MCICGFLRGSTDPKTGITSELIISTAVAYNYSCITVGCSRPITCMEMVLFLTFPALQKYGALAKSIAMATWYNLEQPR